MFEFLKRLARRNKERDLHFFDGDYLHSRDFRSRLSIRKTLAIIPNFNKLRLPPRNPRPDTSSSILRYCILTFNHDARAERKVAPLPGSFWTSRRISRQLQASTHCTTHMNYCERHDWNFMKGRGYCRACAAELKYVN